MNSERPLAGAVWIVVVGAGLGIGYNALRPRALPWVYQPPQVIQLDDSTSAPAALPPQDQAATPSATDIGSTAAVEAKPVPTPTKIEPARGTVRPSDPGLELGASPRTPPATSPSAAPPIAAAGDLYADLPESEFLVEIGLAKAKELYDRGGLLVLDARDAQEFAEGHIAGAVSAPYDDVVADLNRLDLLAKEPRPILCYCGGGECELSLNLGQELTHAGHRRVLVLKDGFPGWKEAAYPTAEGGSE